MARSLATLAVPGLVKIAPLSILQHQAVLVPIPLGDRRMKDRGFNQSLDLAHHMSEISRIPVVEALSRVRGTWRQSKLPTNMRTANVAGSFQVDEVPPSPFVLLVDDVTTSGATLMAAADELSIAMPKSTQYWGVVIARG